MKLNLALAQVATKLGDVESNLDKHHDIVVSALHIERRRMILLGG